jgi:cobalt transporter subunit CbtA
LSGLPLFRQIVWSALLASIITGVVITLLQSVTMAPLIAQAEEYERAAADLSAGPAGKAEPGHAHASSQGTESKRDDHAATRPGWEPNEGFETIAYTALTTTLAAFGYALLLGAVLSVLGTTGLLGGLVLSAAGFAVFQLAPALGLPPEPPGVPSAALLTRQLWWLGTVIATALGLACLYFARKRSKLLWLSAGVGLMVLPHWIGAPHAPMGPPAVPDELIDGFAWMAILTAACFWAALGVSMGHFHRKVGTGSPARDLHSKRSGARP